MDINQAITLLRKGELVAIPTETVYGLAADATNPTAIQKIFAIKHRPEDNPLIVHVGHKEDIIKYATIDSPVAQLLIDKLMPGPLTILLPKKETIPYKTTAGSDLVAIRIPDHPIALTILQTSGLALAAPSANISGAPSPTNVTMVAKNFGNAVPIIDGGSCTVGIESTVAQVIDNSILIHRPGFITPEDIASVVGADIPIQYSNTQSNISPGIKYKHYAPNARIHLLHEGMLPIYNPKTVLIVTDERISQHKDAEKYHIYRWGSHENILECAQNLYKLYHQADIDQMQDIYIEELSESSGVGYAIMNRVRKSLQ